jgi:putative ABC transport system permease protein
MPMDAVLGDLRLAVRRLWKHKGFTAAACATLVLGIGAVTAAFSVVYGALLKPLPYRAPDELVALATSIPQLRHIAPSLPVRAADFEEFRRSNSTLAAMAALRPVEFTLTGTEEPERLYGARVSANLFTMLGVSPVLGRTFEPEDDVVGRDHIVLISHGLWVRRFGSDPHVLGRTLRLNDAAYTIVGIMPADLLFPTRARLHALVTFGPRVDVWKPMGFTENELLSQGSWDWAVIGRLKPGVTLAAAQEDLGRVAETVRDRLRAFAPASALDLQVTLTPLQEVFAGNSRRVAFILASAAVLLLAIACVNLAHLLLSQLAGRRDEFHMRLAIGASRRDLVRQLLTESTLLAAIGGGLGVLAAAAGVPALVALAPPGLETIQSARVNVPVLLFAIGATLVTSLAFGVTPALRAHSAAGESGHVATGGRSTARTRRGFVIAEVTLCTALLAMSGLLVRSLMKVMSVEPGFVAEHVLGVDISLASRDYPVAKGIAFYRELLDRVRTSSAVTAAAAISALPLQRASETAPIFFETDKEGRIDRPIAVNRSVTPGYLAALGIPLRAGRFIEDVEPRLVVVVGEGLARRMWPGDPLTSIVGRKVKVGGVGNTPAEIIGVVGDVRTSALDADAMPVVYRSYAHMLPPRMTIAVRTTMSVDDFSRFMRRQVHEMDAAIPVPEVTTMRQILAETMVSRSFQTLALSLFAALALALTAVGVYGVISGVVASQTKEIAVRMALGAPHGRILRSVLAAGLRPVVVGAVLGIATAVVIASLTRSLLFGVEPLDPVTLLSAALVLMCTAVAACCVPALRAVRVTPSTALRFE